MKKRIIIRRFLHNNEWRYGLFFDFDPQIKDLVKTLPGISWSQTNRCWHFAHNEENLKNVISVMNDKAEIDISSIALPSEKRKLLFQVSDTSEVRRSDTNNQPFSNEYRQSVTVRRIRNNSLRTDGFGSVKFSINETDGRLVIKFPDRYDQDWIRELKSYRGIRYNEYGRDWSLRWSQLTVDSLSAYFASKKVKIIVEKASVPEVIKKIREVRGIEVRSKELSDEAVRGLEEVRRFMLEKRYSSNSISSYISHLEFFFKYFEKTDPADISDQEIESYMHDYIIVNKYSPSFQNQAISAIKIFYSLLGGRDINSSVFERPRRSRSLPKVFSKEEIQQIFNGTRNSKHKLILWMVYSCGLRRSEVINIRLTDLDSSRGTLHIREGKGNVDRIVPVSQKIWEKIRAYLKSYKPREYLFEGQGGGRYSVESVYNIFKQALRSAGIKKDVGIHSLRHSYATHLHENGLDIRYIQELLGHRSTRTTEIYTHVSRKDLFKIKSPIEDIDID